MYCVTPTNEQSISHRFCWDHHWLPFKFSLKPTSRKQELSIPSKSHAIKGKLANLCLKVLSAFLLVSVSSLSNAFSRELLPLLVAFVFDDFPAEKGVQ